MQYVLLVDDEPAILKALERELRTWAADRELSIHTVGNAEEALGFLKQNHLDTVMVISDQRMPGMKGHELLATCSQRYPGIITIMLTGYTDIQDITQAIRGGIFSFVLKPWEHEDLLYEVTKAYNTHELRNRNREYLQLIRNELSLAAVLRGEIARGGDHDHGWCRVGCRQAPSPSQTARGVDALQQVPIGTDYLLLLAVHLESDGVRGSMIGATMVMRMLHTILDRQSYQLPELSQLVEELLTVIHAVGQEMPTIMISFTVGILDRKQSVIRYAGTGYPPWIVVREQGFGEMETHPEQPEVVKTIKIEPGDTIAIASPGLLEGLQDPDGTRRSRVLARLVRGTGSGSNLSRCAELVLAAAKSPAEPTDLSVMLIQTTPGTG